MKGRPVEQVVYGHVFHKPKPNDPANFHAWLQRNLIPEVRQETHSFYGHLDTQEAKYPGLDYSNKTHRIRLSRWPAHRRLFRAFDALALTNSEIAGLTKWEGTKWAKEKFEKEQGITIRDTTADSLSDWVEPTEDQRAARANQSAFASVASPDEEEEEEDEDKMDEDEDSEGDRPSVGIELNERIHAARARRHAGDSSAVLDEEWEQWLKNAVENGELAYLGVDFTDHFLRSVAGPGNALSSLFPPAMINAARAGFWQGIPESFHPMLRRAIEAQAASRNGNDGDAQNNGEATPPAVAMLGNNSGRLWPGNPTSRSVQARLRPVSSETRDSATSA